MGESRKLSRRIYNETFDDTQEKKNAININIDLL
jgi:hypothetical protein